MSYLFFDTETTGFPVKGAPWSDEKQPHLVQIAAILYDDKFNEIANVSEIIYPEALILDKSNHGLFQNQQQKYTV